MKTEVFGAEYGTAKRQKVYNNYRIAVRASRASRPQKFKSRPHKSREQNSAGRLRVQASVAAKFILYRLANQPLRQFNKMTSHAALSSNELAPEYGDPISLVTLNVDILIGEI